MAKRNDATRFWLRIHPARYRQLTNEDGAWHEDHATAEMRHAQGERERALLRWVKRQMRDWLTPRQRRCIRLYYFRGWTLRRIAAHTGWPAATVHRSLKSGVERLRRRARKEGVTWERGG